MAYRRPARGYSNRRGSFSSRRTTTRRRATSARRRAPARRASSANRLVIEIVQPSEVSRGASVLKKLNPPSHKAKF